MSGISFRRPHGRSIAEARKLADELVGQLAREYDLAYHWEGDSLHFERKGLAGQLNVTARDIEIEAKLGLLLRPFKSRIEKEANDFLDTHLA